MTNPMTMYQRSSFINKYKCGGRRKAWIGAAIGAAGSLIGGMFGSKGQQLLKLNKLTKLVIVLLKLVLNVLNGLLMVMFSHLLCLNQYIEIGLKHIAVADVDVNLLLSVELLYIGMNY